MLSYIGHAVHYATLSGFLTTLFPTELRYTGISFGYQLSGSLVSGFVPWSRPHRSASTGPGSCRSSCSTAP